MLQTSHSCSEHGASEYSVLLLTQTFLSPSYSISMSTLRPLHASLLAALVAVNCSEFASADSITKTPSKDNTLIQQSPGEWSCGMATYFFAGRVGVNGGSTLRRGAVRFDISAIPAGATVTSVSLRMYPAHRLSCSRPPSASQIGTAGSGCAAIDVNTKPAPETQPGKTPCDALPSDCARRFRHRIKLARPAAAIAEMA